jgi:NADH-quinone oxidoreductase subunit G
MVKITVNGKALEVSEGTNVLDAALHNGIHVEHFCYHRYLPVAGNCRTCMVEIETPRGPQLTIGCNTKVAEGMVIHTQSDYAKHAQKSALEMLLLDHPLDCPICDKAGECKLQDQYLQDGRYDFRRSVPRYFKGGKAEDIGEHIILDQERCVLCTRCIRFVDEVSQTSELCIVNRGHEAKLTIFPGYRLDNPYSGNVTDICPVGALTLKEFRFKQRVWLLKKAESVCPGCARGCNITVEQNHGHVFRFMPRENPYLNKTWICDEGRFAFPYYQTNRFEEIRVGHRTTSLAEGIAQLAELLQGMAKNEVAAIASPYASLEDNYLLKKLFERKFNPAHLAAPLWAKKGEKDDILRLAEKYPNEQGLNLLGIPTRAESLLEKIEVGAFKAVLVMHQDPFGQDPDLARKVYGKVKVLACLSSHQTETTRQAAMAFPMRTFLEQSGTFINATGRLQKFKPSVEPTFSETPEASLWIARLAKALGLEGFDFEGSPSVFNALAKEIEILAGVSYGSIPDTGLQLSLKPIAPEPFQGVKAQPNVFEVKA